MEQNISFDNSNPSKVKDLFRKICILGHGAENGNYVPNSSAEKALRYKIKELENELQQARKEKDKALTENKSRINELSIQLLSVKTGIRELMHYKQERDRRLRSLEKKIIKTIK